MMRAITVQQPWAFAIATGEKTVENRVRQTPWHAAVGQTVAIHAGKAWDETAIHDERLIAAAKAAGHLFVCEELDPAAYDYGAVLATAELAGVHLGVPRPGGCRCAWNAWAEPGSWHLVLRDIRRLREPVPARGMQGLWSLPHDVEALVREQLARVAA